MFESFRLHFNEEIVYAPSQSSAGENSINNLISDNWYATASHQCKVPLWAYFLLNSKKISLLFLCPLTLINFGTLRTLDTYDGSYISCLLTFIALWPATGLMWSHPKLSQHNGEAAGCFQVCTSLTEVQILAMQSEQPNRLPSLHLGTPTTHSSSTQSTNLEACRWSCPSQHIVADVSCMQYFNFSQGKKRTDNFRLWKKLNLIRVAYSLWKRSEKQ